ncbi:hypothetical protein chiPu_0033901, partial [Chiloscyllium punctatum]|nr:hypothetical protein [Chiloscyllium punctatum]
MGGNVGHHNGHEEDHGLQELVTDRHGDAEEGGAEEDGEPGDDVDEVLDLYGDGGLLVPHPRRQARDPSNDGPVPRVDDDASARSCRRGGQGANVSLSTSNTRSRVSLARYPAGRESRGPAPGRETHPHPFNS